MQETKLYLQNIMLHLNLMLYISRVKKKLISIVLKIKFCLIIQYKFTYILQNKFYIF